ncbi:MAG TPA: Mth938-like domain-containing protein [Methylotenera sp.]|nr:Mth938-like domain-containing protein [Methylotenera sp.]HPV43949.1 Mth938-like domain-containing protein [Methylotenera sp.]
MKLHLTTAENNYLITGYGGNYVEINQQRYAQNLIVMPQTLILNWQASIFADLSEAHFAQVGDLKPEVVLLGTGEKHQFLHPKVYQSLTAQGIPLECMTTAAACRTYNFLMSEGRNVAAALILQG